MAIKKVMGIAVGLSLLLSSTGAHAVFCLEGCNQVVNQNFNHNLSATENQVGRSFTSNQVIGNLRTLYWEQPDLRAQWGAYVGESVPSAGTVPNDWVYQKIDDYISIGLRASNYRYFPYNKFTVFESTGAPAMGIGISSSVTQPVYQSRLRIDKKIVSGTYTKNIFLAEVGLCEPYGCRSKEVVLTRIYANLNITVPQSCVLNAGQIVTIDFGPVSSGAFQSAGAPAQGTSPVTRNVSVQCDNIQAGAALTMRLQANKTSGSAIVSNNPDVVFTVMDTTGKTLIPNNLGSFIPFLLSGSRANVEIRVQPVSITGKRPKEGPVTSEAYLRIDFP
ncbi:fimbrial protein [Moellerella wisconsensis]|uniref:fimbrial protein n=1 Tax=Moellerella wisconsensis TaxID=158849 RepID=UPI0025AF1F90|nr:fimbrial protein [Moellerella wisconsensis]WJW80750.1 fimbrial protein [Moellerella wisconsensis]